MFGASTTYGRLMRREVVDICLLIFIADVVVGVQIPIFPLYATSLGASLQSLGLITAMLGLGRLASALPVGMLSDRLDRKTVLTAGMLVYALSFGLYAVMPSAEWLIVPRALQAVGMVATFPLGVAYIGDVVDKRDRGAALGVYMAAMGSGFAVGPLIGSWLGATSGYPSAYVAGAVLSLAGAVFAATRLIRRKAPVADTLVAPRLVDLPALAALLRNRTIIMACVANIAFTLSMTGAIFTYFPVYAKDVGLATVTIGTLFAWRSLASATGRLPMGPLSSKLPAHWTLAAVLVVEAAINLAISHSTSQGVLTALLLLEGIGFGVFLVSSQSAVSEASQSSRGAAVGLFWMAGSVGDLFGPIVLGVIAQRAGLVPVFESVAGAVLVGAVVVFALGLMPARSAARA